MATDTSGNADIKDMFPDCFYDNIEAGILSGMIDFLEKRIDCPGFDAQKYNKSAVATFLEIVSQ